MAAGITVTDLTKGFASTTVVEGLDLEVGLGEVLVLLGPSGCGKTTTLRCLAGLETPDGGTIGFGDRTVFDAQGRVNVPIHRRNIGMVFQSYALWPHMTVRQNIAYPLRVRGTRGRAASDAVEHAAGMVHCEALLDRYPAQLSGGQQQRIALARGLVAEPAVVLLDEPLSNLDATLRDQMRTEIRELHQKLGFTAVLVTHDQEEALALGDRVAIMKDGRIEQLDTPEALFLEPVSEYVAGFVGMSNRIEWSRDGAEWVSESGARLGGGALSGVGATESAVSLIRPEDLRIEARRPEEATGRLVLDATIVTAEYGGRHLDVTLAARGTRLHARTAANEDQSWIRALGPGAPVAVSVPYDRLHSYAG